MSEPETPNGVGGRPRKADPPRIDYQQLDKLLVFGEVVPTEDGLGSSVVYPTNRASYGRLCRMLIIGPVYFRIRRHQCRSRALPYPSHRFGEIGDCMFSQSIDLFSDFQKCG